MAPGEATGEGAASVAVEGPGLHAEKLRLGTMNRAFKRFLVKVQLSQQETPVSWRCMPVLWDDHQNSTNIGVDPD